MGEHTKVVEEYPVDKLPEELRAGLAAGTMARITVEPAAAKKPMRPLSDYFGTAGRAHIDPVADIRKLRDEWDD